MSYCVAAVGYKFTVNVDWFPYVDMVLSPGAGLFLYLIASLMMFVSAISLFNYGYLHYNEAHKTFMKRHKKSGRLSPSPVGCEGYIPHTFATVTLVIFVALRGAIVYDNVTLYRTFNLKIALVSIVMDVSYMLIWISTWFCFTIKQEWSFKILAYTFHSEGSVTDIFTIQNNHARDTTNLNGSIPNGKLRNTAVTSNNQNLVCSVDATEISVNPSNAEFPGFDSNLGRPNSALRKSGERRNSNNRVTFEDSRDENDGADAMIRDGQHRRSRERDLNVNPDTNAPPARPISRKKQRKLQLAALIHGTDNPDFKPDEPPKVEEKPQEPVKMRKKKVNRNIFGDFEISETPENTLKRNYRNSIRDKCGQYYRHSADFSSPPAAQSSPVLPPKHGEDHGLLTGSLDMGISQLPPEPDPPPPRVSRPPPRNTSPARLKKERLPSPPRTHGSFNNHGLPDNSKLSYQSQQSDSSRSIQNPSSNSSYSGSNINSHSSNNSLAYQPHHVHSNSNPQSNSSSHGYPPHRPLHLPQHAQQDSSYPHPSGPVPLRKPLPGLRSDTPSRELQIVNSNKPDMGRRDSALPSSNETSSNDSQDVLCSQV